MLPLGRSPPLTETQITQQEPAEQQLLQQQKRHDLYTKEV